MPFCPCLRPLHSKLKNVKNDIPTCFILPLLTFFFLFKLRTRISLRGFVRPLVCRSVSKIGKTRLSAPAHQSATGGRVSGPVLKLQTLYRGFVYPSLCLLIYDMVQLWLCDFFWYVLVGFCVSVSVFACAHASRVCVCTYACASVYVCVCVCLGRGGCLPWQFSNPW